MFSACLGGAPLAGVVIDHSSSSWGYAVTGVGGVLVAGLAVLLADRAVTPVTV